MSATPTANTEAASKTSTTTTLRLVEKPMVEE